MDVFNFKSMQGSRIFYTNYGTSFDDDAIFTELKYMEKFEGGDLGNIINSYNVFNKNKVYKKQINVDYDKIRIETAKIISNTPTPFEDSAARQLADLANNKTIIDLIKCIPVSAHIYECTIYSGLVYLLNLDDICYDKISYGLFDFEVIDRKEGIGTISDQGVLELTSRY